MGSLDFAVIAVYIIGIVATPGMIFSRKVKSSKDMFAGRWSISLVGFRIVGVYDYVFGRYFCSLGRHSI